MLLNYHHNILTFIFLGALDDSNDAIKLDETNVKAYLRKGVALYSRDLKEEALQVFTRGLEFDGKLIVFIRLINVFIFYLILVTNEQLKLWKDTCEKELAGIIFFF